MKLATLENRVGIICIVSVEEGVGKTAVSAGLARVLSAEGRNVGYLKSLPFSAGSDDGDIDFMKTIASVDDNSEHACGRDVVLMEALAGKTVEDVLSRKIYGIARDMQAKVIAIEGYREDAELNHVEVFRGFGENLLGIVLNKVPVKILEKVRRDRGNSLKESGIRLLGCLPESRSLLAVTVEELAEHLNGTILNNKEKATELVENFMLGALVVDSGADYFSRMSRKAAIIRQDRPDMQLAALETPTSCLVLGGHGKPVYNVLQKAVAKKVPVITTDLGLTDIADKLDDMLMQSRVNMEKKVACAAEIVHGSIDIAELIAG